MLARKARSQRGTYRPERVGGLRASSAARKEETVRRLEVAINALLGRKDPITLAAIEREGGPAYSTIRRNDRALELWEKFKPKPKRIAKKADPVLSYSRAELIAHLRRERDNVATLRQQLHAEVEAHALTTSHYQNLLADQLNKEERIAGLEAKVARYDQHLAGLRDSLSGE
jgi:hypothetical protein